MFCTHCGSTREVTYCHIRRVNGHLRLSITWDHKQRDGHYPVTLCVKCGAKDYVKQQYLKEPVPPNGNAGERTAPTEQFDPQRTLEAAGGGTEAEAVS